MSELYGETHRAFQDRHDTRRLADRLESLARTPSSIQGIASSSKRRRSSLSARWTSAAGPRVSVQGRRAGLHAGERARASSSFRSYDGNGMFLSPRQHREHGAGGTAVHQLRGATALCACRVRHASAANDGPHRSPGAIHLVHIAASQIFVNCGRYIHKAPTERLSPHVPNAGRRAALPRLEAARFHRGYAVGMATSARSRRPAA